MTVVIIILLSVIVLLCISIFGVATVALRYKDKYNDLQSDYFESLEDIKGEISKLRLKEILGDN